METTTALAGATVPVAPAGQHRLPEPSAAEQQRADALRTLTYLMLFRVALATLLLLSVLTVALTADTLDSLSGPFGRFISALLAATYLVSIGYALTLKRVRDPLRFAYVQIGVDLLLITLLVHATGGAQSGYTFLYMVDVVAVALLPRKYVAAIVATASVVLLIGVAIFGYARLLPTIPGQTVFPWDTTRKELLLRVLIYVAGIVAVGALGISLSSQRRQVGERLVRHQQLAGDLASLHENTIRCLSSGLVTVSMEGIVTSMNEAASDILAISGAEALGRPLAARIPGLGAILAEAGPVGSIRRAEVDAIRPEGIVRRLGVSAAPLSDHTGQVIGRVIHFQDLTELRRMEVQVQRSERLASVGRLAAGIAHEIRNPLASISGSVEVLKSLPGADTETRQLVDIAVREVDRLNALISDLLDYARPRTEERQALDLGEVVTEIGKAFDRERREAEVRLEVDAGPGAVIEGASTQMRQVLWNLLRNAAEAMPKGGTIRMSAARRPDGAGQPEVVLSVTDTGVGIARDDLDRIFEPFFSRKAGGTGLGLATVARIVEDHRGAIDVNSEPSAGTTFTLRFPAIGA